MKLSKRIARITLFSILIGSILMLGCGGGGGGGGGGDAASTVGIGPGTTTTTDAPPVGGSAPPVTGLTVPTGFSSAGFPAVSTSLTIPAVATTRSVVLVNNAGASATVSLSASVAGSAKISGLSVSRNLLAPEEQVYSPISADLAFHKNLRDFEKRLPKAAPTGAKAFLRNAVRADFLGQKTQFSVVYGNTTQKKTVTASCKLITPIANTSSNVIFYFDDAATYSPEAETLITTLSAAWAGIYTTDRATFGSEPPASFNSLGPDITVLLSPSVETAGFFYSGDLYPPTQIETGISNQRKMFYLQYSPHEQTSTVLAATMAHEFQHMINFYQKKLNSVTEEDWLNEGLSGYAEHVCGYKASNNNQSKALQMNRFFASIATISLVIDPWPGSHENYGQVYLFGVWLGQHFGTDGSVVALLASKKTGIAGIAEFTGESFDKTFAKWMIALSVNDTTGGTYGYKDLDLKGSYSYGSDLADVTLTGPAIKASSGAYPYATGNFVLAGYSSAYVELSGGSGSSLNVTLPSGITAFEMHK